MASATAFLELNLESFDRAIATAKRSLAALGSAFAAYKTVEFLSSQTNDALKFAQSMFQVSRSIGNMDTGSLLIAQKALEQIGYSASGAQARITEMVQAGIPLSVAFGGAKNYSDQLKQAAAQWGGTAAILSKAGNNFSLVWDRLQAVVGKVREFFLGMTGAFLQPLQVLLDRLTQLDLGGLGAKFGESIGKAITALNGAMVTGTVGDIISAAFEVGAGYLNDAADHFSEIGLSVGLAIGTAFLGVVNSFDWGNLGLSIGGVLAKIFVSIGELLARTLNAAWSSLSFVIAGFREVINFAMRGNGVAYNLSKQAAMDRMQESQTSMGETFGKLRSQISGDMPNIMAPDYKQVAVDTAKVMGDFLNSSVKGGIAGPKTLAALDKLTTLTGNALKAGAGLTSEGGKGIMGVAGKIDPFSVIASSMAKIGGGGNFVRVGMSIEAKNSIITARSTAQSAELLKSIHAAQISGTSASFNPPSTASVTQPSSTFSYTP